MNQVIHKNKNLLFISFPNRLFNLHPFLAKINSRLTSNLQQKERQTSLVQVKNRIQLKISIKNYQFSHLKVVIPKKRITITIIKDNPKYLNVAFHLKTIKVNFLQQKNHKFNKQIAMLEGNQIMSLYLMKNQKDKHIKVEIHHS